MSVFDDPDLRLLNDALTEWLDPKPVRNRLLIIHNANAGPAARWRFRMTLDGLTQLGARFEVAETVRHGEAMQLATEAARHGRYDAVVAAGGDGTIHDVAEGLVGHATPLGIIPLGTANVLAREIGLGFSPDSLVRTLVGGKACPIPLGDVSGRPFLFVVGVGFDARAVRAFETRGTRQLGQAGLAWPVLQALVSGDDPMVRVWTNRGKSEASWVIVTRAKRYAGGFLLTPEASVRKGHLYVVRFAGAGPISRLRQLSALASGLINYDPGITVESTQRVIIEGDPVIPVQIDGELLGQLPLEIGLHAEQLQLIVPKR